MAGVGRFRVCVGLWKPRGLGLLGLWFFGLRVLGHVVGSFRGFLWEVGVRVSGCRGLRVLVCVVRQRCSVR